MGSSFFMKPIKSDIKSTLMEEGEPGLSSEDNYLIDHQSSQSVHRPKRPHKKEVKSVETVEGKWTEEEAIKFALYIEQYQPIFNSKEKRKASKIFVSLSEYLGTRTPRQCRSHFQKLITKFRKINKIRAHYESILGPLEYARRTQQISTLLKKKEAEKQPPPKIYTSFEVQTEPMLLKLADLSRSEISKLMVLLQEQLKDSTTGSSKGACPTVMSLSDDNQTDLLKKEHSE